MSMMFYNSNTTGSPRRTRWGFLTRGHSSIRKFIKWQITLNTTPCRTMSCLNTCDIIAKRLINWLTRSTRIRTAETARLNNSSFSVRLRDLIGVTIWCESSAHTYPLSAMTFSPRRRRSRKPNLRNISKSWTPGIPPLTQTILPEEIWVPTRKEEAWVKMSQKRWGSEEATVWLWTVPSYLKLGIFAFPLQISFSSSLSFGLDISHSVTSTATVQPRRRPLVGNKSLKRSFQCTYRLRIG